MQIDWQHDKPFTQALTVCAEHIDGLGHTNNNVYSQWCEEAAWKHSASLGLDASDYQRLDRAMVIHKAEYQYHLPSFDGDELVIGTWLTAGKSKLSMQRKFQLFNQASGELLFQCQWQLVCIKLSSNKPARIPAEFIDAYLSPV